MLCAKLAQVLRTRPPTRIWSVAGFPLVKKNVAEVDYGRCSLTLIIMQKKTPRARQGVSNKSVWQSCYFCGRGPISMII